MDNKQLTEYIKSILDKKGEEYEEIRVVHNVLYVRCQKNSPAESTAVALRKTIDPEWSGKFVVEYLDGTQKEIPVSDFGLELDFE